MSTLPKKDDIDRFDVTVASGYGLVITPDDAVDLPHGARGVYVGTTGHVAMQLSRDSGPVTYHNLAQGMVHPFRPIRVYSTGTTALNIRVMY